MPRIDGEDAQHDDCPEEKDGNLRAACLVTAFFYHSGFGTYLLRTTYPYCQPGCREPLYSKASARRLDRPVGPPNFQTLGVSCSNF